MRVFKTKLFARFARRERISDASLREAVRRAERGLEHDPEKWAPVFGKDHAPPISQSGMTIRRKVITL